jgi:hypothetical protein
MATDTIGDPQARWLPVSDAAAVLGVSDEILRLRMSRQAIGTRVDPDGRVFVRTPYDLTDYIRAGVTAPAAEEEAAELDNEAPKLTLSSHAPVNSVGEPDAAASVAATAPARPITGPLQALNEARIADLKEVIVQMTERHSAEVERLMDSHQAEMQRLVDLHGISTKMLHEQAQHTARIEAEGKSMLIGVINALNGRK